MNSYTYDLDLDKSGSAPDPVVMRQGDHLGTTIEATLFDHGAPYTTAGLTAYFAMTLPGGEDYYRASATYSAGVVSVTVDEEYACIHPGHTSNAYFELHQGTSVIASTASIPVVVLPSATQHMSEGQRYDDEIVATVNDWLDDHPEATTTVVDDSLTTAKFKDGSVTTPKIADGAVTTEKIAGSSVTTAKLDNLSVTEAKLAADAVTTAKIADESVTVEKLDPDMFVTVTNAQLAAMFD